MKILVTGGAGFIGSNFIHYVLAKHPEDEIINLDKLTYAGNRANCADLESSRRYTFVHGDIADRDVVERVMAGCEAVVNFAAETHVDRSIASADDFIQTNFVGTAVLLEAARKLTIARYLQISTDEVYGSILEGSFTEDAPLNASSPYSASKAGADMLVKSYCITYGLNAFITRSCNNFGPYQFPEKVIPLFVTNLLDGKKVPLYGDGLHMRDWLYVEDSCAALDIVLRQGERGQVYNIGSSCETTNYDLTHKILMQCEKTDDSIEYVTDRLGHDRRYSITSDKVHALGWKPQYTFDEALEKTVQWYRDNRPWWEPLKQKN